MKVSIFALAALALTCSAFADGVVHYEGTAQDGAATIYFGGLGLVDASKTCYDASSNSLKTKVEAADKVVCDEFAYNPTGDSEHPAKVCVKSHVEHVAAGIMETPMEYKARVCSSWNVNRADSEHPVYSCAQFSEVTKTHSLTYVVDEYASYDYDHSGATQLVTKKIANCVK